VSPSTNKKPPPPPTWGGRMLGSVEGFLQRASERGGLRRHVVHMAHLLVVGIRRSQITRMAAALSYRTIFGLIPVLVVSVMVLAAFASDAHVRTLVTETLKFSGLSNVMAPGVDIEAATTTGEVKADVRPLPSLNPLLAGTPVQQAVSTSEQTQQNVHRLDQWISGMVEKIQKTPKGAIGLIGMLLLIYAAIGMLIEIEKAFNQIYNAPEGRSWVRRVTQYWTLLTLGTIFLVGSFLAGEQLKAFAENIPLAEAAGLTSTVHLIVAYFVTVAISTLLLTVVYLIVPNTRVQVVPALSGAIFAALLWEAGKWGFTSYVANITQNASGPIQLYGSLAIIPLFFLWVYITWVIVLLGLQLASALQLHRNTSEEGFKFSLLVTLGLLDEDRPPERRVKIVDPASVLVVLTAVAERFGQGKPSDHAHVAQATCIDEQAVADMLERLAGAGILLRVVDAEHDATFTLSRPPAAISATEVFLLSHELVHGPGTGGRTGENPLLSRLSQAQIETLKGKTIADLLDKPPASTPPDAYGPRPVPAPG
jgi:membrane protein